jgi:hypothetical protein
VSGYLSIFCVVFMFEGSTCLAKQVVFGFRLFGWQAITSLNRVDLPTLFATPSPSKFLVAFSMTIQETRASQLRGMRNQLILGEEGGY